MGEHWFLWSMGILVIVLLFPLVVMRGMKPKTKTMQVKQAALNRKNGADPRTPPAYEKKKDGTEAKTTEREKAWWWLPSHIVLSIFVALLALIAAWWGLDHPVSPADAGSWSWRYWLSFLVVLGGLYLVVQLNSEWLGKPATKAMGSLLIVAGIAGLLALPVIGMIQEHNDRHVAAATAAQLNVSGCTAYPGGTATMQANGDSSRIPVPSGCAVSFDGFGFAIHCVYEGYEGIVGDPAQPCRPGSYMPYVYVHDVSGQPNTVKYAFFRNSY